jgi:hypothetical protein
MGKLHLCRGCEARDRASARLSLGRAGKASDQPREFLLVDGNADAFVWLENGIDQLVINDPSPRHAEVPQCDAQRTLNRNEPPHLRSPTPKAQHIIQPNGQPAKQAPPWVADDGSSNAEGVSQTDHSPYTLNFSSHPCLIRMRLAPKRDVREEGARSFLSRLLVEQFNSSMTLCVRPSVALSRW